MDEGLPVISSSGSAVLEEMIAIGLVFIVLAHIQTVLPKDTTVSGSVPGS